MPDLADLGYDGDVAIVTIANPPVNALSHGVRAALQDVLVRAGGDAAVSAIVIACAGRTFVAGADIAEFGKPPREPVLTDVIATIEAIGKPIVAALHGTPLGGGLELALACHFRVAAPGTRLGLPEIKLGIIPGAGGTQRLPRLVGMDKAMAMILSGEPIGAAQAHEAGLVDDVVTGDLLTAAVAFARRACCRAAAAAAGARPRRQACAGAPRYRGLRSGCGAIHQAREGAKCPGRGGGSAARRTDASDSRMHSSANGSCS